MYFEYFNNVIMVLFFCGVVILIDLSLDKKYSSGRLGFLFGLITIFVMRYYSMVIVGRFYDFRHITMTMAGFIGGPLAAGIALAMSGLYRCKMGGSGMMGGMTTLVVFACFGLVLRRWFKSTQNGRKILFWYLIGIAMTFVLILIIASASLWKSDSQEVLKVITIPYLIITPLATTIIVNFYYWAYEYFSKASILQTIINYTPINLVIFNRSGPILLSKTLKSHPRYPEYINRLFPLLSSCPTLTESLGQYRHKIATQDDRHLVADLSGFRMPSGEPACVAVINDVTDLIREHEKLRVAKERFSKTFELGPHMMSIIRKSDYSYIHVNRRFLEKRGFDLEYVIGKTPMELGVPEWQFQEITKIISTEGSISNYESSIITKHGSRGFVILSAVEIQIDDQECYLFAYNDVTEMKLMQMERVEHLTKNLKLNAELSQSNQFIADIINNMPDGFYVLDGEWRFTYVNKKTEELFFKTREKLLGNVLWEALPGIQKTTLYESYQKIKDQHISLTFEYPSFLKEGAWYQVTAFPFKFGISVYFRDITESKLISNELIKSQHELASVLESMTDCFLAVDGDWIFTYINRACEIALGKSSGELLGKKMTEIFPLNSAVMQRLERVIQEQQSVSFEVISERLDNKWLEINAYPLENGLICYLRDISSRKLAEFEIARLDRLNLVGQLAAGIGHEIRNPMTTVRGYLQLLGTKAENAAQKPTYDLMISELDRANSIITEFLSLARTRQTELKYQSLNTIIAKLYPLLEADAFNQNKQIKFMPEEIPDLQLNEKELSQLVLNLSRNGLEAMEERGCLTIKVFLQDRTVVLSIEDQGCGIPKENMPKIGTPFFTTKENGTGLGLATCFRIAESHNARIMVDSSPQGTIFKVLFPIVNQANEQNERIA
ncbi:PAS domain S-box protein [Desulfosporosinus sp. PR]|uniref:PAS domain S-box protein n=1 Tax=Candidatus Desulfosporosinus nitrosoreducens TaxID=3401928 RepID=UPI0027F9F52C|nr:PAS domain S-box protein [Desulfosporosinus sp. PR]MDQ7096971.1 PAS domain S-box protein [Desulfosporosinus sp. PR]